MRTHVIISTPNVVCCYTFNSSALIIRLLIDEFTNICIGKKEGRKEHIYFTIRQCTIGDYILIRIEESGYLYRASRGLIAWRTRHRWDQYVLELEPLTYILWTGYMAAFLKSPKGRHHTNPASDIRGPAHIARVRWAWGRHAGYVRWRRPANMCCCWQNIVDK